MSIEEILQLSRENNASDIHLSPGNPVELRIDGELCEYGEILKPNDVGLILEPLMSESQKAELDEEGEVDFAFSLPGFSRIRVNIFRQRGTLAAALRILAYDIPSPKELGIPDSVVALTEKKRGLVLVTGATGSGKSTTLASLIEVIAQRDAKNIITLEDPIEYLHTRKKSIVSQREIGKDTKSYAAGLRAALREDPDVILVGEMRDTETIAIALSAAETGHLVLSTLHTTSAYDAMDRITDVFPAHQQPQIRLQLASVLQGVVAQQLMPLASGKGRKAVFEVLLTTPAVQNLIRESKTYQIPTAIQTSKKEGMQLMDDAILDSFFRCEIDSETAISYANDPLKMQQKVKLS